jgi:hypothetical protein
MRLIRDNASTLTVHLNKEESYGPDEIGGDVGYISASGGVPRVCLRGYVVATVAAMIAEAAFLISEGCSPNVAATKAMRSRARRLSRLTESGGAWDADNSAEDTS